MRNASEAVKGATASPEPCLPVHSNKSLRQATNANSIGDNQPEDSTRFSATASLANIGFHLFGDNNSTSNSGSYHLANGMQYECHVDEKDASNVMVSTTRGMIGAEVVVRDDSNKAIAFDMPLPPFSSSSFQRSSTPMDGVEENPPGVEAIVIAGERIVQKDWTKDNLNKIDARRLVAMALDFIKLASTSFFATNQKKKYDEVLDALLSLKDGGLLNGEPDDSLVTVFELSEARCRPHISMGPPGLPPPGLCPLLAPIEENSPVQSQPPSTRLELIDDVMNSGKDSGKSDSSATIRKDTPIGTKQLSTRLEVREDIVDSGKSSDESDNFAPIRDESPVESQLPPSQLEVVDDSVDSGKGSSESKTSVAPNTSSSSDNCNNKSDVSSSLESNSSAPIRDGSTVQNQNKSVDDANKSVTFRANTSDVAENELERVMTSILKKRKSAQWTKLVTLDNTSETNSPEPDFQDVVEPTTQVLPQSDIVDQSSDSQLVEDSTIEDVQVEKEESVESSGQVNTGNNSTLSEPEYPSFASLAAEVRAAPQMEIEAEKPIQMQHVDESTTPVTQFAMDVSDESIYKDNNSTTSEPESETVATLESDHELNIHIQLINDLIAEVEQDPSEMLNDSIYAEDVPSTATSESEDSTNASLPTSVQLDESAKLQLDQTFPVVEEKPAVLSQVTRLFLDLETNREQMKHNLSARWNELMTNKPLTQVLQPIPSHDNSTSSDQLKASPKTSLSCKRPGAASKSKKRVQKKNRTKLDEKMSLESEFLPIPILTEAEQDHLAAVTRDKLCLAFLNMFRVDECTGSVQKFDVFDNLQTFYKSKLYIKTKASFDMERFVSSRVDFSKKNHKNGVIAMYRSLRQLIVNRMTFDEIAMATLCYLFTKKNKPDVLKEIETRLFDQVQEVTFDYLQDKLDKCLMTEMSVNTTESTSKSDISHSIPNQMLPKFYTTELFNNHMDCHQEKASSNSLHAHFAVIYEHLSQTSINSVIKNEDSEQLEKGATLYGGGRKTVQSPMNINMFSLRRSNRLRGLPIDTSSSPVTSPSVNPAKKGKKKRGNRQRTGLPAQTAPTPPAQATPIPNTVSTKPVLLSNYLTTKEGFLDDSVFSTFLERYTKESHDYGFLNPLNFTSDRVFEYIARELNKKDSILFPICRSEHWILTIIGKDFAWFYDPLHRPPTQEIEEFLKRLEGRILTLSGPDTPRQSDNYECGSFCIVMSLAFINHHTWTIEEAAIDTKQIRAVLRQELSQEFDIRRDPGDPRNQFLTDDPLALEFINPVKPAPTRPRRAFRPPNPVGPPPLWMSDRDNRLSKFLDPKLFAPSTSQIVTVPPLATKPSPVLVSNTVPIPGVPDAGFRQGTYKAGMGIDLKRQLDSGDKEPNPKMARPSSSATFGLMGLFCKNNKPMDARRLQTHLQSRGLDEVDSKLLKPTDPHPDGYPMFSVENFDLISRLETWIKQSCNPTTVNTKMKLVCIKNMGGETLPFIRLIHKLIKFSDTLTAHEFITNCMLGLPGPLKTWIETIPKSQLLRAYKSLQTGDQRRITMTANNAGVPYFFWNG